MSRFGTLLFGQVAFQENEEYLEFQYRFLIILLVSGAFFTGLFLIAAFLDVNRMDSPHLYSMRGFTVIAIALWLLLRGKKERFQRIAWCYEAICLMEYVSALILVPQDELRLLWFYTNIPGIYILLGQRAGMYITSFTVLGFMFGNSHLSAPYSPNAIATAVLSMIYLGMFFHVYGDRSISYFVRMREYNKKLHQMATHDMLTGVLNARAFYEQCNRMIHLSQRARTPFSVLFVDLDHFKLVNDTYGHAAGDIVLKAVAENLGQNIRLTDALGRIGGEEFSIFLQNTDLPGALQLAETLRIGVENLMPLINQHPLRVTASIGVARSRQSDQSMLDIQQLADKAMYVAKQNGRNRVSALEEQ